MGEVKVSLDEGSGETFFTTHIVSAFERPSWTPSDCKQTIAAACSAAFLLHSLKQHNDNSGIAIGQRK